MQKNYILAIDNGTTSSRAILFDRAGRVKASAARTFGQIFPRPGYVEHDPEELFESVAFCAREAVKRAGISADEIDSIGITNQRETVVVWDRETGRAAHNAIVWQCRRTAAICEGLKRDGYEDTVAAKTGLNIDAYFSATKLKWLLDNAYGVKEGISGGRLVCGTVDAFLLHRISKGKIFATDCTNASRTMLFNIHDLRYDSELLKLFNIPESALPPVSRSSHFFGLSDPSFLGAEIPITGVAGDQQAALFGQLCVSAGEVKSTYGTGCFLLIDTGGECVKSKRGLVSSLAAFADGDKPQYCLEGSVFAGGSVVQWLRDGLGFFKKSADSEKLAKSVPDSGGVSFVPAFTGLGAPHWDPAARGLISGITRGVTKAHIVRAGLEAIAFQVFDVLHAAERDTGLRFNALRVDGGAAVNDFLMQFQADICGIKIRRPAFLEVTALGAAYLAGLCTGFFKSIEELKSRIAGGGKEFIPAISEVKRNTLLLGWEEAVLRAKAR